MHSKLIRMLALPAVIAGVAVVPAAAQASNASIKQAIVHQDKLILNSTAFKEFNKVVKREQKTHQVTRSDADTVVREAPKLARKLDHAASVVASKSASTSKGKFGRNDWVKYARDLAKGFKLEKTEYKDLLNGNKSAAKAAAAAALRDIDRGERFDAKADRDLGLQGYGPMIRA